MKPSVALEKWITIALNIINDALYINPNYPVGDDNEPTFTAPSNKADIECYYETFDSICEVTLLTSREQWYNEGQPVMRHLRKFENESQKDEIFCLFVAPRFHQDTINTFWFSVKYEYEGKKQRIIPLTITQIIELLKVILEYRKNNQNFPHEKLHLLYGSIMNLVDNSSSSEQWITQIPKVLKTWVGNCLKEFTA